MIKNTEAYYIRAKEYQGKRAELVSEHEKKLKSLEKYKGSQGYQKDKEKEDKRFNDEYKALQDEYRSSLNTIMDGMESNIRKRGITPPSNDQLNLIHMLKMRKKVTEQDCDRVAQMLDGNALALGALQEVARDNNIHRNYESMSNEMSSQKALDEVSSMRRETEDFLKYDTSYASRYASKYYTERYGGEPVLFKRKHFEDQAGCYKAMTGLTGDALSQFSAVVDGSGSDDQ